MLAVLSVSAYALFSVAVLVSLALAQVPASSQPVVLGLVLLAAALPLGVLFLAPRRRRAIAAAEAGEVDSDALAAVCHEIRTSLNAVLGFSELLEKTHLDPVQARYMSSIRESGAHLLSVVDNALDHGKAEAGAIELEEADTDLDGLVRACLRTVSPAAAAKGLELGFHCEDGVPRSVRADAVRIRQVLLNLLSNAVKFTAQGKVAVTVWATPAGGGRLCIHLGVQDTGIGIPAEARSRLFAPFSQVGPAPTRYGGAGLGLALSRGLCRLMDGDLTFTSRPGRGSTFTATFQVGAAAHPAPPAQAAPRPGHRHPLPSAALSPALQVSILLVEDDAMNRRLALKVLEDLGFRADVASDGEQAVTMATQGAYDVVLLDVHMPVMDGLEAARTLRRTLPPHRRPFIVGLTASALPGDRERCLEAGMDDYLPKPMDQERLAAMLEGVGRRAAPGRQGMAPTPQAA